MLNKRLCEQQKINRHKLDYSNLFPFHLPVMFCSFILFINFIITTILSLFLIYLRMLISLNCWLRLWLWGITKGGATITLGNAVTEIIAIIPQKFITLKPRMVRYWFVYAIKYSPEEFYACLQYFPQYLHQAENGKKSVYSCSQMLTRGLLCVPSVFSPISSLCSHFELEERGTSSDGELYQLIANASFNVPSALHALLLGFVRSWLMEISTVSFASYSW